MSELQQFCVKCGGAISFDISQAGTSIFCLHCGQKVQLKSDSATPPEPSQSSPPLPAINDTPEEIFLLIDNQQHGPHSEATLSDYLKAGQVAPDALAWHEGAEGWKPLSEVLGAAAQPPATPLSPPAGGIPKRTMAGTAPAEEKPEDSEGGDPDQIRVTRKGEPIGPYSREKAKEYFASGQLLPTDWGWHDGMDDWKPLNEVLGPAAPTAIATECPNGHGETREWEGQWRCWECGWPDNSGPKKKPIKKKKKPNKVTDWLGALGGLLLMLASVGGFAYLFYDLFLADGILEKKEMGDLKQRLEKEVLPKEEYFLNVITRVPRNDHRIVPIEYGEFGGPAMRKINAAGELFSKARMDLMDVDYQSDTVKKLRMKYESPAVGHLIDWGVWYSSHNFALSKRKLDKEIMEKFRDYKRRRKVVLDELDREFQSYGLGSLKR